MSSRTKALPSKLTKHSRSKVIITKGNAPDQFPKLSGYLKKKSRTEKWQKRWFETSGHYLTYYKNQESQKLLACIDLWEAGDIQLVPKTLDNNNEEEETDFSIGIEGQFYIIKAPSEAIATKWVNGLSIRQKRHKPQEDNQEEALAIPEEVVSPAKVLIKEPSPADIAFTASERKEPQQPSSHLQRILFGSEKASVSTPIDPLEGFNTPTIEDTKKEPEEELAAPITCCAAGCVVS